MINVVTAYGADPTGALDSTTAINNALSYTASLTHPEMLYFPPGLYNVSGQLQITCGYTGFYGDPNIEGALIQLTYVAAPAIIIGNGSTSQLVSIQFENIKFNGPANQVMFKSQWVTEIIFNNCYVNADMFFNLGDNALVGKPTYKFHLIDCQMRQAAGGTHDFINASNFGGQFVAIDTFIEGQDVDGAPNGFVCSQNVSDPAMDHIVVVGGVCSRFTINWDFNNTTALNIFFTDHFSERARVNAMRFQLVSAAPANSKYRHVFIDNCRLNSNAECVLISNKSSSGTVEQFLITESILTGGVGQDGDRDTVTSPAIKIEGKSNATFQIVVDGIVGDLNPATSNAIDFIQLVGSPGSPTLREVIVDNVAVGSFGNIMRSVLRIEGGGNVNVRQGGNIVSSAATKIVDDNSGVALRSSLATYLSSPVLSWAAIAAHVSASVNASVPGAAVGDIVTGNVVSGSVPASVTFRYAVVAAGQVQVTATNNDTVTHTPSNIGFQLEVRHYG